MAGQFRGRNLIVPDTRDTRPTMDKTRQAIFNILRGAAWAMRANGEPILVGATIGDFFAGSGAFGFEALSQGAQFCIFVENAVLAQSAIQKNVDKIGLAERTRIIRHAVSKIPEHHGVPCDVIFMDPPYDSGLLGPAIEAAIQKKYAAPGTLLVLEMREKESPPDGAGIVILDTRQYGVSKIVFAKIS